MQPGTNLSSNRVSRRRATLPSLRRWKQWHRLTAAILFLTCFGTFTGPHTTIQAQPVPVPSLNTNPFQSGDFDPYFQKALSSNTQASWEYIVSQGRYSLAAQWEAAVDTEIANHLSAVGTSDHFHTVAEYRDYLKDELQLQKQTAFAAWELSADVIIEGRRESFLAALAAEKQRKTLQESDDTIDEADTSVPDISDQQRDWEEEFGDAVDDGFQQFQKALGEVHFEYTSFLGELQQKEDEFEEYRLQIEHYEQVVRDGIQQTVYNLDNYLQSNGLFHKETCVAEGAAATQTQTCTTDMNTYSDAGDRLNTLIHDLQDGLDQDAPLSTLATLMNDYLEDEHQIAEDRRDYWDGLIRNNYTYDRAGFALNNNAYGVPEISHALAVLGGGMNAGIAGMVAANNDPRVVESVNWANVRGYSHSYNVHPDQVGHSGAGESYNPHGDNAFHFNWEQKHTYVYACPGPYGIAWCPGEYTSHHTSYEQYGHVQVNYNWYDPNADANHQIWSGYVNDMDPVLAHWRDNIVPSIQNWEAQVAEYTANHQAYLASAAVQREQAAQQYNDSVNRIVESRNKWLTQMSEEYRKGRNEWVVLGKTTVEPNAAAPEFETTAAAFSNKLNDIAAAGVVPEIEKPDLNVLVDLHKSFQQATQGVVNLALAGQLNDNVVEQRNAVVQAVAENIGANYFENMTEEQRQKAAEDRAAQTGESIPEALEALRQDAAERQYNVTIDENGRIIATRDIASGNASRTGGNGTSADDYTAEQIEQRLVIAPPPAVKLVATAGLFDTWDHNEVMTDHFDTQETYGESLTNYYEYIGGETEAADEVRAENQAMFQAQVEANIVAANNRRSGGWKAYAEGIFQGVMSGLSIEAAAQQFQHNQWAAEAARLTGIPMDFFGSVLAGGRWQDALTDATEYLVEDYTAKAVAKATGLPIDFIGGMVNGASLDISGETMGAAFQNYTNQVWSETLEEQTGIPGLGALVMERMQEHIDERERVNDERNMLGALLTPAGPYAAAAYAMKHTEFGREATNSALGVLSGRIPMEAMGLPPGLGVSGGLTGIIGGQLGCDVCQGLPGGMIPADADELWDSVDDMSDIANGRVDGRDLEEKYRDRLDRYAAQNQAAMDGFENMTLADLPGRIGQGITGYLSGAMGAVMGPLGALMNPPDEFSPAELAVRESLMQQVVDVTGQNEAFLMSMARGESAQEALYAQAYDDAATSIYGDDIPPQLRAQVVGAVRQYTEHTLERLEFQRQRERAANDPWNIWRGAQYGSKDQQMALQAAEIGAGVAASVATAGWAAPAFISYMAAKGSYMGSQDGGGAIGALAGGLSVVVSQMTPVQLDLAYSEDNGFGGSIGFGYQIENTPLTVGASISFQEGEGITGAGLNAGVKIEDDDSDFNGVGGGLSLNFDGQGTFTGGSLGVNYGEENEENDSSWGVNAGLNFGSDLSYTGFSAGANASFENFQPNDMFTEFTMGMDFNFNREGDFSVGINQTMSHGYGLVGGVNGVKLTNNNTFSFNPDGSLADVSQNIDQSLSRLKAAKARENIMERWEEMEQQYDDLIFNSDGMDPDEYAERMAEFEEDMQHLQMMRRWADPKYAARQTAIERAREAGDTETANRLMMGGELTKADWLKYITLHEDNKAAGDSRDEDSWVDTMLGKVEDGIRNFFWHHSDDAGYVDAEGNYHERTCFTAGTLIRVHPDTKGAFERNGAWFKEIENIRVGDVVLSWNEGTGELSYNPVTFIFENETTLVHTISYEDGTVVETTWNHPFYIAGRGWVETKDLRIGQHSYTPRDLGFPPVSVNKAEGSWFGDISVREIGLKITGISQELRRETVYNIEVDKDHTYFVTESQVLVHNYLPFIIGAAGVILFLGVNRGLGEDGDTDEEYLEQQLMGAGITLGAGVCVAGGCAALATWLGNAYNSAGSFQLAYLAGGAPNLTYALTRLLQNPANATRLNFVSQNGTRFRILPSALKHVPEFTRNATTHSVPLQHQMRSQQMFSNIEHVVNQGIRYGEKINYRGWEFIFQRARDGGTPVLIHAQPTGM